jgi:hypothetical protein
VGGPDVLLTRRRWAWYFAPATVTALALGGAAALSGEARFLAAPAGVLALWWWVRRSTPRGGMRDRRLSADPEVWHLLGWGALCLGLVIAAELADGYVTGRPFGAPYRAYHLAVLGPVAAVFLAGTFVIARRGDRRRAAERSRAVEPAAAPDRDGAAGGNSTR